MKCLKVQWTCDSVLLHFSRASLTSWGEGASLAALVGHPSSDGVMIKMPYGVEIIYIRQLCTPSFLNRLVKTESGIIVRSVETGLGR